MYCGLTPQKLRDGSTDGAGGRQLWPAAAAPQAAALPDGRTAAGYIKCSTGSRGGQDAQW